MTITNTNLLQPSGFKVAVDRKNYPHLEYFVQRVDHPSVSVNAGEASYSRIASVPMPGDKLEFGEVTFDMILDEDMAAYTEMFIWMKRLVEHKYTTKLTKTDELPASEADITLMILNSANRQQKKIIYRNAFPTNLGNISMESGTSDVTTLVCPISFRYTYFDLI